MNIILQPASNPLAQKHFIKTVEHGVSPQELIRNAEPGVAKEIQENLHDSLLRVWGVLDGPNNNQYYNRICYGDLVLFCKNWQIFAYGEVVYKVKSRQLAAHLWGRDKDNRTWQNIYFMNRFCNNISIPMADLNEAMGYGQNHTVQNFSVIDTPADMAKFFRKFRYSDGILSLSSTAQDYKELLLRVQQLLCEQKSLSSLEIMQRLNLSQDLTNQILAGGVSGGIFVKNGHEYSLPH